MIERIRLAVVDTEPLMSALILDYAHKQSQERSASILSRSRLSDYLKRDRQRRTAFIELFQSIPTILTTSHCIGELKGLQTLTGDYERGFWDNAMQWLKAKKVDEKLIRLFDLDQEEAMRDLVCQIGPPDTGLIELAQREGCLSGNTQGKVLLTEDKRTLAPFARKRAIEHLIVEDYLNSNF